MLQERDCVVFDLDGTLADTSLDLLSAANACFREMGAGDQLSVPDTLVAFQGGRAMLRLGFSRLKNQVDEEEITHWYPKLITHYHDAVAVHSKMYPGAVDAILALKAEGKAVAVCTNKPEALAEALLQALEVRGLFDALVGADTLPQRKPDPAPYLLAVSQAGGSVTRSVMIGDTVTDLDTARAVGRPVALVTFGPEGESISRLAPDALLHHYNDLPDVVAGLLG